MLLQALKGNDPVTMRGTIELAMLELSLLLPLWVVGAMVMEVDLPTWWAMGLLSMGWIATSVGRLAWARWRTAHRGPTSLET